MPTKASADCCDPLSAQVIDFQARRTKAKTRAEAPLLTIPSNEYIPLVHLAHRAENIWRDRAGVLRQDEFALLDIRARDGKQIALGEENYLCSTLIATLLLFAWVTWLQEKT